MKKLMQLLLFLIFSLSPLLGGEIEDLLGKHVVLDFTGNEENLYVEIDLSNSFKLPTTYTQLSGSQAIGCELLCTQDKGEKVYTSDGRYIQDILLTALFFNTEEIDTVLCKIYMKVTLVSAGYFTSSKEVVTISEVHPLLTPSVNLAKPPEFGIYNSNFHTGYIQVKNLYRYSDVVK